MRRILWGIIAGIFLYLPAFALADDGSIAEDINRLKIKIAKLEKALVEKPNFSPLNNDLAISGGITLVIQASHDANKTSYKGEDVTDCTYSMDINLEKAIGNKGNVFLSLEAGSGNGLDNDEVILFSGTNYDAAEYNNRLEIAQAGYKHFFLDEKITLTFGKLDATCFLDENEVAGDETSQFLGSNFVHNPVIEFPDNYTLGSVLAYQAFEQFEIKTGMFEDDADYENIFDDNFFFAQLSLSSTIKEKSGNYRIYVWCDTSSHVQLIDSSNKNAKNYGFGISCDQKITDNIAAFIRIGNAQSAVSNLKLAWSLGVGVNGSYWSREQDAVGIAVGQNVPSDEYGDIGNPDNKESHFEAYYNFYINDNVSISPDIQAIWNPNGVKDSNQGRNNTIIVGNLRTQLIF